MKEIEKKVRECSNKSYQLQKLCYDDKLSKQEQFKVRQLHNEQYEKFKFFKELSKYMR